MEILKRDDAIERIVKRELENWVERFQEQNLSYFEDLIKNGGVLYGFTNMNNSELTEEYYEMFEEEVQIV